jgi:putative transcriptional regulator
VVVCKVDFTTRKQRLIIKCMQEKIENTVSKYRTQMSVTQEELASKVNVSRQTIIALEKGNYTPSILLALKIAGFFKMPVEKLFKISYEK